MHCKAFGIPGLVIEDQFKKSEIWNMFWTEGVLLTVISVVGILANLISVIGLSKRNGKTFSELLIGKEVQMKPSKETTTWPICLWGHPYTTYRSKTLPLTCVIYECSLSSEEHHLLIINYILKKAWVRISYEVSHWNFVWHLKDTKYEAF